MRVQVPTRRRWDSDRSRVTMEEDMERCTPAKDSQQPPNTDRREKLTSQAREVERPVDASIWPREQEFGLLTSTAVRE